MNNEKIFIVTDGCMWEINKKTGDEHPHAMEVVDAETGAVRYIRSGSKIKLIEGSITDIRTQVAYNKETQKAKSKMSSNRQDLQKRTKRKSTSPRRKSKREIKSV